MRLFEDWFVKLESFRDHMCSANTALWNEILVQTNVCIVLEESKKFWSIPLDILVLSVLWQAVPPAAGKFRRDKGLNRLRFADQMGNFNRLAETVPGTSTLARMFEKIRNCWYRYDAKRCL